MGITDELREYAHDCCARVDDAIHAIADRIDAAHEEALSNVYTDKMDASGWVKLPKDAGGEYIHIGDVMEYPNGGREEVRFMTLNGAGWLVNEAGWLPVQLHHHHAPTVEDVLREMADRIYADEYEPRDRDAIVAEFAAKLQLRGDEE